MASAPHMPFINVRDFHKSKISFFSWEWKPSWKSLFRSRKILQRKKCKKMGKESAMKKMLQPWIVTSGKKVPFWMKQKNNKKRKEQTKKFTNKNNRGKKKEEQEELCFKKNLNIEKIIHWKQKFWWFFNRKVILIVSWTLRIFERNTIIELLQLGNNKEYQKKRKTHQERSRKKRQTENILFFYYNFSNKKKKLFLFHLLEYIFSVLTCFFFWFFFPRPMSHLDNNWGGRGDG